MDNLPCFCPLLVLWLVVVFAVVVSCLAGVRGMVGGFMAIVGAGAGIISVAMVASILRERSSVELRPEFSSDETGYASGRR